MEHVTIQVEVKIQGPGTKTIKQNWINILFWINISDNH